MKKLIILEGLPASGKSSYTNKYKDDTQVFIYENDFYRESLNLSQKAGKALNKHRVETIDSMFNIYNTIIADGVNISKKNRKNIYDIAKAHGADVETIYFAISIDESINRQANREEHKKVPADIIKNMAANISYPKIGYDTDSWSVVSTDSINQAMINAKIEDLKSSNHDSIYHVESIGSHINMIIQDIMESNLDDKTKSKLIEIARFHDIEKNNVAVLHYGYSMYAGHANASANTYLATIANEKIKMDESNSEILEIFEAILYHQDAHNKEIVECPMANTFAEFDDNARIISPMTFIKGETKSGLVRKYMFSYSYNPLKFYFQLKRVINKYNLSSMEVNVVIEDIKKHFNNRSAIFSKKEKIGEGLEAFFNVNQFDFLKDKEDEVSEGVKSLNNFFISLSTPKGDVKKFSKVDGSLIQVVNYNGELLISARTSFLEGKLDFLDISNGREYITNLVDEFLKTHSLPEGDTLYLEFIGKMQRIVLKYNTEALFIPLKQYSKKDMKWNIFNTDSHLNLNESSFEEGFILYDENGNMFKEKTLDYFQAHTEISKLETSFGIINLLVNDNLDDISAILDEEVIQNILKIKDILIKIDNLEKDYNTFKENNFDYAFVTFKDTSLKELKNIYLNENLHYFSLREKEIKEEMKSKNLIPNSGIKKSAEKKLIQQYILANKIIPEDTPDYIINQEVEKGRKANPYIGKLVKVVDKIKKDL